MPLRQEFSWSTPCDLAAVYHRLDRDAKLSPETSLAALKTVRFAGFRRLDPVVPDRAAFGAAIEDEAKHDHAENQCYQPEHYSTRTRPAPLQPYHTGRSWAFSSHRDRQPVPQKEPPSMQREQPAASCDIDEARRVLGDVFAPWVRDLNLSIEAIECAPPPDAAPGWQPGAILRMP